MNDIQLLLPDADRHCELVLQSGDRYAGHVLDGTHAASPKGFLIEDVIHFAIGQHRRLFIDLWAVIAIELWANPNPECLFCNGEEARANRAST